MSSSNLYGSRSQLPTFCQDGEQMRTAAIFQNRSQWSKMDVIKLFMCSVIVLQCIDLSNGRALKSFTSLPVLYYSYRLLLQGERLSLAFSSITTPLILYWLLEAVATFTTLDIADVILYVALKICLFEVLRMKMPECENTIYKTNDTSVAFYHVYNDSNSTDVAMDVTQSEKKQDMTSTIYHTIHPPLATLNSMTSTTSVDLSTTPLSYSSKRISISKRSLESSSNCYTTQSHSRTNGSLRFRKEKDSGDWKRMHSRASSTLVTGEARCGKSGQASPRARGESANCGDLITNPMFTQAACSYLLGMVDAEQTAKKPTLKVQSNWSVAR
ncbi:hypothetical protein RB195_006517 [Necator americanus]|uniref:Uncharacterized protein n=1 Tax=Necator americanus TaxID=51031 RepID=A0ABR1BT01_NECAM